MSLNLIVAFLTGSFVALIIFLPVYFAVTKRLSKLAYTDQLTELPNYHKFMHDSAVLFSDFDKKAQSIILIDLDNFKKINDLFGYNAGDEYMRYVAGFFLENIKNEGRIYRYKMGDEFVVVSTLEEKQAINGMELLKNKLQTEITSTEKFPGLGFSYGLSKIDFQDIKLSLKLAEERLQLNKAQNIQSKL